MADIAIPSPSVFLQPSPPPASLPPAPKPNAPKQHARRASSAEEKKKASRKNSGGNVSAGAGGGSVVKPKQSKSRNGCVTCKAKRLKCGEEKPGCQQCARRKVECGGYKKDFKWRPFEETNVKHHIERQKRGNSPKQVSGTASTDSSKQQTPDATASLQAVEAGKPRSDDTKLKRDSVLANDSPPLGRVSPGSTKTKKTHPARSDKEPVPTIKEVPEPHQQHRDRRHSPGGHAETTSHLSDNQPVSTSEVSPVLGPSPTLTELLMLPLDMLDKPEQQEFMDLRSRGFQSPGDPMIDPALHDESMALDDIHEIDWDGIPLDNLTLELESRRNSVDNMNDPGMPADVFNSPTNYIYPQPYLAEDSPEMLSFRFDRMTCGILSMMDGPHENPWRTLIWPLTPQSPALYHALFAMTAFHASTEIPQLRIVGHEHKAASIRFIKEGIRDNSMGDQTAIATALALGFAESWDQHTSTGNTHIKGAQALVRRALERHARSPLFGDDLARLKFLCNAWVYMDVIARLTCVDSDESLDFDNTFIFSGSPHESPAMVMGESDAGFGIDFGMPIDAKLDPLMGCASTLFPLIGRVANLVRKVCRSQVNSPAIISQADDLKTALEAWDPPDYIERPQDPSTDVAHTLQTAEAYRWATLLHLHATVPELPSLNSAELAQRVLQYLATVPLASRTVIVQIYPLMVAGCEASAIEDRQWVRARWAAMNHRMRIGINEKTVTVTEEVWRRRDNYEAQPPSNRKLVATADINPSRGRGQPLIRTDTGSLRLGDPGRTGMVFSYVEDENDGNASDNNEQKKRARARRNGRDPRMSVMDVAYTVRGHLHWVGVMWDWGWESRLSQ